LLSILCSYFSACASLVKLQIDEEVVTQKLVTE